MTLEERIKIALDKCAMSGWQLAVLQNEIACVARVAVEEEREACARLIDKQAVGFQVLANHAPTPLRERDLKSLVHALEDSARLIRARSEKPN